LSDEGRLAPSIELLVTAFRGRVELVAAAVAVSGLCSIAFDLLEDVLHRLVVADRVDDAAVVVVACDNDGAVGKPSSVPQTPRPHSAFVHLQKQIGGVSVCLNPPFRSIDG
jgi:hypothetical protein